MTAHGFVVKGRGLWVLVLEVCPACGQSHEFDGGDLARGQPNEHLEQICPATDEALTLALDLEPHPYVPTLRAVE